jgi:hypothetical protein
LFETGLRATSFNDVKLIKKERAFNNVPFTPKTKDYPKFLKNAAKLKEVRV